MAWDRIIDENLSELRAVGQFRRPVPRGPCSFSHNDYLGLSGHPRILEAGRRALSQWEAGSGGSRLLGGHHELFDETESLVAKFFGAPSSLLFSTGYLANLAVVTALGKLSSEIFTDEFNHASLIDGIRLSGRPKQIVPHNAWNTVEPKTVRAHALFVSEVLFSMEGDFVHRNELESLVRVTGGFLILDEAHSAGVFREEGRGFGVTDWSRTAVVVTFGKAFGVGGAAVLCCDSVRDLLINTARTFIFTTAPPPVVVAMVAESLGVCGEAVELRRELWRRATRAREVLSEVPGLLVMGGWDEVWSLRSPILSLSTPGNDNALRFCELMRELRFELKPIRYPTVAKGRERVRISVNLSVTEEETERMIQLVASHWKSHVPENL